MWEELSNYSVNCTCGKCTCGGAKDAEHTMSFLMGLNESFSQIRGQILLMDPIPSLNKIFSLIIQEDLIMLHTFFLGETQLKTDLPLGESRILSINGSNFRFCALLNGTLVASLDFKLFVLI